MSTRFSGSARSGVSPVTLVVFILLTVVAGVVAFVFYTQKEKTRIAYEKVVAETSATSALIKKVSTEKVALGDYLVMEKPSAETVKAYFEDPANSKGLEVAVKNFRTVSNDLDLWILRLRLAKADLENRVTAAAAAADVQETASTATRDDYVRRVDVKKAELQTLDQYFQGEVAKREALVKQYGDETRGFTDRYNNARDEHETKKSTFLRAAEAMTRRNAVVRRDLKVLRPEPSIQPPVGHVVRSDWQTNKAVIDIGGRQNVFPGLVLEVYAFNKDGQRVLKGKLDVMTVDAEKSLCNVIEMDEKRPILAGDPVQTRFMPIRPGQRFVISGFIPPDAPYDEAKLKAIIELNGGVLQDSVGLTTDCLILGETGTAGIADLDKKTAETVPDKTRRGLDQAEVARELSVDIVDYEDFIQGLLN